MANYYELLKVSPSASAQEISSAFDTQYEQWRRLVTHHDPKVVNQANQAIQLLEQIRGTLGDPTKRAAYDEGIGLRAVGGLADPTAILNIPNAVMTPPPPRQMPTGAQAGPVVPSAPALWTCPKCTKENPPNTRFCFNCGTQLVRTCPECGQETSLVATGFCGNCGYNYDVALNRRALSQEMHSLQKQMTMTMDHMREAEARKPNILILLALVGGLVAYFSLSLIRDSSTAGCGVVAILIGAGVAGLSLVRYANINSKKQTDISNAQNEYDKAGTELNRLQQEHDALALRKTEMN